MGLQPQPGVHWTGKARSTCWPLARGHLHKTLLKWTLFLPTEEKNGCISSSWSSCSPLPGSVTSQTENPAQKYLRWLELFLRAKISQVWDLCPGCLMYRSQHSPRKCVLVNIANASQLWTKQEIDSFTVTGVFDSHSQKLLLIYINLIFAVNQTLNRHSPGLRTILKITFITEGTNQQDNHEASAKRIICYTWTSENMELVWQISDTSVDEFQVSKMDGITEPNILPYYLVSGNTPCPQGQLCSRSFS